MGRRDLEALNSHRLPDRQLVKRSQVPLKHLDLRTSGRSPIPFTIWRIKKKADSPLRSKQHLPRREGGARATTKSRGMQGKPADHLEAMEYAIREAAIQLGKECPIKDAAISLHLRARLLDFVRRHVFYSKSTVSLQRKAPRRCQIESLTQEFLAHLRRSTPGFQDCQDIQPPTKRTLSLLFDCALEARVHLESLCDFQFDLLQYRPGDIFNPELMSNVAHFPWLASERPESGGL